MIDVRVNDEELRIINVYYPADKGKANKYPETAKQLILLGDLNFASNYELDRTNNVDNDKQANNRRKYNLTRPYRAFNKFLEVTN